MSGKGEYPTRIQRYNLTCAGAAYTAGDQVGDVAYWDIVGETGTKAGVTLTVIGAMNAIATQPALDILLFEREPRGTAGDNSPAAATYETLRDRYVGHVKITTNEWSILAASQVFTITTTIPIQHFTEGAPGRIWGLVITRTAYTPAALTIGIGVTVD